MTTKTTSPGQPSFLEIGVPNGGKARDFFKQLFGWEFHDMRGENFWIQTPTLQAGLHADDADSCMVVYFAVADIEVAVQRVRELGGEAQDPGPGDARFGRFAECRDTQGVRFGLH